MREKGFTILEVMIAVAVMLVVMGAAVSLYQKSVQVSSIVTRQSDMQTELRASLNQLARDLNQAGAGVPVGGIPIPSAATGTNPKFACDGAKCYITTNNNFTQGVLYKVTPANGIGPTVLQASDAIIITYLDPVLSPLVDPNLCKPDPCNWSTKTTTTVASAGTSLTMPTGLSPAMNDPTYGLFVGDVLFLQNPVGAAAGVVTSFDAGSRVITFADGDPLNINQSGATGGNIKALKASGSYPAVTVSRVMMITYFIQQINTASGPDTQLMRQIGARTPTPVADHIEDLQFTYDVFDSNTSTLTAALPDAATGSPPTPVPNQIRKINITMTVRSPRPNAQGVYEHYTLTTSIGPRNLSFQDRYK